MIVNPFRSRVFPLEGESKISLLHLLLNHHNSRAILPSLPKFCSFFFRDNVLLNSKKKRKEKKDTNERDLFYKNQKLKNNTFLTCNHHNSFKKIIKRLIIFEQVQVEKFFPRIMPNYYNMGKNR